MMAMMSPTSIVPSPLRSDLLKRAQDLTPRGAMSRGDYDSSEAEYMVRKANVAVAEAACEQAKAKLAIAEASLDKAQRNLDYCVIRSPVDGVIIDRRVSIGQTLVSSMSASSIFLIAKDLKKRRQRPYRLSY